MDEAGAAYSAELGERICARVATGTSLRALGAAPGMPHRTTVRNWARSRPEFGQALRKAMQGARIGRRMRERAAAAERAAAPAPLKGGKASAFTPALGEAICARIANGESVVAIGRDPDMPAAGTIYGWVRRHPEFEDAYVHARQLQADFLFDEAREVAIGATPKSVWADRLRFDVIRWQAARLAPRKYCERLVVLGAREEAGEAVMNVYVQRFTDAPDPDLGGMVPGQEAVKLRSIRTQRD